MKQMMTKHYLPILILAAFALVAAFSFVHFYSMLAMGMEGGGHSACAAYSQISQSVLPPNQSVFFFPLAVLVAFFGSNIMIQQTSNRSFLWFNNRWRINSFSPQLLQTFLFRKGILNSRIYA